MRAEEGISRVTLYTRDGDVERGGAQLMREKKRVTVRPDNTMLMFMYLSHTLTTTNAPVEPKVHTASKKIGLLMVLLRVVCRVQPQKFCNERRRRISKDK